MEVLDGSDGGEALLVRVVPLCGCSKNLEILVQVPSIRRRCKATSKSSFRQLYVFRDPEVSGRLLNFLIS